MKITSVQSAPFPEEWPPVTVLIVTYNRAHTIRRVIQRYELYLKYVGSLLWRLADDGSPPGYVEDLQKEYSRLDFRVTMTDRGGFGANLNNGLREAFKVSPYVFLTEDDWATLDVVDLTRGVWLMESIPEIGLVRYDEAGIYCTYHAAVLKHSTLKKKDAWTRYFVIDRDSRYIYPGGHPQLVHQRYYDAYGFYHEGGEIASVERRFSDILREQEGPQVVVMADYVGISKFRHTAKTWKGTPEGDPNFGQR